MKNLLLLSIASGSLFLTSCTTVVERDVYYRHPHPHRREVVVYGAPLPPPRAVYYYDHHGRYYWNGPRRIYVEVY